MSGGHPGLTQQPQRFWIDGHDPSLPGMGNAFDGLGSGYPGDLVHWRFVRRTNVTLRRMP